MIQVELYHEKELDLSLISELWEISFERKFDRKNWEWFFKNNPFQKKIYIGYVILDNKLVSYSAIQPTTIYFEGKHKLKAGNMNMWMTHPDYRKMGLLQETLKKLMQVLKKDDFSFLYSFPTRDSSWNLMKKYLEWNDITDLIIFQYNSTNSINKEAAKNITFEKGFINQKIIDILIKMNISDKNISIERTECFLEWRFIENPSNKYHYCHLIQGNEIILSLVYKKFRNEIDIMEIFNSKDIKASEYNSKILYLFNYLISAKEATQINVWAVKNSERYKFFKNNKLSESDLVTHFGIVQLNKINGLNNSNDWHLSFMDSDVY